MGKGPTNIYSKIQCHVKGKTSDYYSKGYNFLKTKYVTMCCNVKSTK